MIIQINNEYRIESGNYDWIIQKPVTSKGEVIWRGVSYHGTLAKAADYLFHQMVRELPGEVSRVEEIVDKIDEARDLILKACAITFPTEEIQR